jgi:head-tail adaptor
MLAAGRLNKSVSLSRSPRTSGDSDGFFEALSPATVWAAIQPLSPSPDGRTISSLVTIRYHDQVGVDTRVLFGTRELFVRSLQNVDEQNVELRLLCEEVINQ